MPDDMLIEIAQTSLNKKMVFLNKQLYHILMPWFKRRWIAANKIKRFLWRCTFGDMYPIETMRALGLHDIISIGYVPSRGYWPMFAGHYERPPHNTWTGPSLYCRFYSDTPIGSNGAHKLLRSLFVDAHIKMRRKVRELPIQVNYLDWQSSIVRLQKSISIISNSGIWHLWQQIPNNIIITKVYVTTRLDLTSMDVSFNGVCLRKIKLRKVGIQDVGNNKYIKYESADHIALMIADSYMNSSTNITSGNIKYDFIILKDTPKFDRQLLSHNLLTKSDGMLIPMISN
jgi:hypothetical protein